MLAGAFGRPVVVPARPVDLAAGAAKQGVVRGQFHRGVGRNEPVDDQPGQHQPDLVDRPAGLAKQPVGPAVVPQP